MKLVNIWTKRYMLRPVAHCKRGSGLDEEQECFLGRTIFLRLLFRPLGVVWIGCNLPAETL